MANEDLSKLKIDKSQVISARSGRKKAVYAVLAVLLIIALGAAAVRWLFFPAAEVETIAVGEIYPAQTLTLLNASGYVVAQRKSAVASKITGRLISIAVEEGDVVKKGDVIARLENEDSASARKQAAANLEASRAGLQNARAELTDSSTNLERQKDLLRKDFISKSDYDVAETRYKKADAGVANAEALVKLNAEALHGAEINYEYAFLRAPFDAVVLTKDADIGDIVTPIGAAAQAKAAVVTIADMGSLLVEADVSESNLKQVKTGQPCEIQLDAFPDLRFRGRVHMIVPTADRTKASVLVKVKFLDADSRILPEMSAKVAFLERPLTPEELKPRTMINASSLITKDNKTYAFRIEGGVAHEIAVTTGERFGDMIVVREGLKPGEKIILKPSGGIRDNTRVKPVVK